MATVKVSVWPAFLLLLLHHAGVMGSGCPDASLLSPCSCTEYSPPEVLCADVCSAEDLQAVVERTHDYRLPAFRLRNSNLPFLNASWLQAKQTQQLTIQYCTLDSVFESPPTFQLPLVREVAVEHSFVLRRVQWAEFRGFAQLQSLSVSGTEVSELRDGFAEGVSKELRRLNLSASKITSLEGLQGKRQLRSLEARRCLIKELNNSHFEDQKESLVVMDFSYNPIEWLPDDLLSGFQQRELFLWLVGTELKTVQESFLTAFDRNGLNLYVEDNPLECYCSMKWVTGRPDAQLFGACAAPPNLRDKQLQDLTEDDFGPC